ncbi:MAG: alpha/beta hydrolase [Acidimicrobiia bacterium]
METARRVGRVLRVVAVAAALLSLAACGDDNDAASEPKAADTTASGDECPASSAPVRDIRYETVPGVEPSLVSLDVYPATSDCPAPVVIWVHGGGWRTGDKRNQMIDKVRLWNDAGYTIVSVNYRLTDPAAAAPVMYPTHNEDVAAAVGWVHDNIAKYGGDPARIALLGHSAGAQIVASIATDERYLGEHGLPLSTLTCAAPLDTEGFDVARAAGSGNTVYVSAFGPDPGKWIEASPILHVASGKDIPPMLLVERGTPGRMRALQQFADTLRNAGVPVTVIAGGALTHAQVNSNIGAVGDTVMTAPMTTFLDSCFRAR